jgi:5-(carboxyamino)imidazole ribonucleotide synthase
MTHQAAISLGVEVVVLCEDADAPAVAAGARHVAGRPDDLDDLRCLASQVDVTTLDHERTPTAALRRLGELGHVVAPGPVAAALGRDKAEARRVLAPLGVPVAPWTLADDPAAVEAFAASHGRRLVLKRPSGGYDGRGVWIVDDPAAAAEVVAAVGEVLVEPFLAFTRELAVLVVRSGAGEVVAYPVLETVQVDGRCDEVFLPSDVRPDLAEAARALAVTVADAIGLVGVMAVELFVAGDRLLLNELALRPHNSGHVTMEACATSQFENLVRAVMGMPLGSTELRVPAACMANVTGPPDGSDPFADVAAALAVPGVSLHRYAKAPRPGRKLGHLTATGVDLADVRRRAHGARRALLASEVAV